MDIWYYLMLENLLEFGLGKRFFTGDVVKGSVLEWVCVEGWISSVGLWGWLLSALGPLSPTWHDLQQLSFK